MILAFDTPIDRVSLLTITIMAESTSANQRETTLAEVMREPSTTTPEVVVLDKILAAEEQPKSAYNLDKDLWISSVNG